MNSWSSQDKACLHTGPKLQQDIVLVLSRRRWYRYAFVTDIVRIFRQILMHPQDRNWLRWDTSLNAEFLPTWEKLKRQVDGLDWCSFRNTVVLAWLCRCFEASLLRLSLFRFRCRSLIIDLLQNKCSTSEHAINYEVGINISQAIGPAH